MNERIRRAISGSLEVKKAILQDDKLLQKIGAVAEEIVSAFKGGKKVLFCGNGGSAADAQHLAAELSGRFYYDRPPLDSEAMHVNTSYITAVANDYSYDDIYSRLVTAKGRKGDVLIGLSTSGNSKNVINAFRAAVGSGMITVGMTGATGGTMRPVCRHLINVPSKDTPRIQEAHIMIGHIICELVEAEMFPRR